MWRHIQSGGLDPHKMPGMFFNELCPSHCTCTAQVRFRVENSSDVLWIPQKGKSVDDKSYVQGNYPRTKPGMSFYAQLQQSKYSMYGGDNALQIRYEEGQLAGR
jgi:hypothetical protein